MAPLSIEICLKIYIIFQISSSPADVLGVFVLMSIGGIGMFMLVITLIVLTAKFVVKTTFDESRDIIIKAEDDEDDDVENECALFIIDDKYSKYDNEGLFSDNDFSMKIQQIEECDRNAANNGT